jgi:Cytochrome c
VSRWGPTAGALLLIGLAVPPPVAHASPSAPSSLDVGRAIYLKGVVGSGAPLEGVREAGGPRTTGADAACVNCHQHSGFGSGERGTQILIPPIAGAYLFHPRAQSSEQRDLPYVDGMRVDREPYTQQSLARAIREGIDPRGRALSSLMPRFKLSDSDMLALIGYLKSLPVGNAPGATDKALHFATVITPEADPVKRDGMLTVMRQYFDERNSRQMNPSRRLQASGKTLYADTMFMVHRQWVLHVWELSGPASGWQAQLTQHLAQDPVFAVISGLGRTNWRPVHEFCEQNGLPCLFPNAEVPVEAGDDFYTLYFSRGVLLESALLGNRILDSTGAALADGVEQVYRSGDSGEAAAAALAERIGERGPPVHNRPLPLTATSAEVAAAIRAAEGGKTLVLWLRPPDIAALGSVPTGARTIYVSGLMADLERAPLPAEWRARAELTYPFDLPEKRSVRVDYPLRWFTIRHIPVVAEQVQADTYLACGLLSEALSRMADNFNRAYLIERLQGMLEHRVVTGYYPRLTLATHQRFASKGGYLVRFADGTGPRLVAVSDWISP